MTAVGIPHVGDDREALAAGLADEAQRLGRVARRALVDPDERALGREPYRGGPADAVRRPGDQGDLADEPLLHVVLLVGAARRCPAERGRSIGQSAEIFDFAPGSTWPPSTCHDVAGDPAGPRAGESRDPVAQLLGRPHPGQRELGAHAPVGSGDVVAGPAEVDRRVHGTGGDAVDADPERGELGGQRARVVLDRRLGHAVDRLAGDEEGSRRRRDVDHGRRVGHLEPGQRGLDQEVGPPDVHRHVRVEDLGGHLLERSRLDGRRVVDDHVDTTPRGDHGVDDRPRGAEIAHVGRDRHRDAAGLPDQGSGALELAAAPSGRRRRRRPGARARRAVAAPIPVPPPVTIATRSAVHRVPFALAARRRPRGGRPFVRRSRSGSRATRWRRAGAAAARRP